MSNIEPILLPRDLSRASMFILFLISCLSPEITAQSPIMIPKSSTFWEAESSLQRRNSTYVSICRHLACITTHVYIQQNLMDNMEDDRVDDLLIVLFDVSSTRPASDFMSMISAERPYLQFVSSQMRSNSSSNGNISDIVAMFMKHNNNSQSVVIFSESVNEIVAVLEAVSLSDQLRYTRLVHTTEWLLVLTVLVDNVLNVLLTWSRSVDFITLVYMPFINTTIIAQQSRTQNLTVKAKVNHYNLFPDLLMSKAGDCPWTSCGILKSSKEILRKSAWLFLISQKSVLQEMQLPVAVTQTIVQDNLTNIDKHAIELLDFLETSLGFSHQFVSSNDSGFYGIVTGDEDGTGILGLLARRDAVLTTMPISLIDNRLKVVNYIPVLIVEEQFFIFYRWPYRKEKIDLFYIYIVKWEFIYLFMGTVLSLGIIGAIVHVATRSCSLQLGEPFSVLDIRRLSSFPGHISFRFSDKYLAHSGRILLGSWAVFLVVLGSAYSGFLVTDFVTADAPPIKSLEQLISNKDFTVGVHGMSEVTMVVLTTSIDTVLQKFLARLIQLNSSDPETLSPQSQVHIDKMAAGGYALLASACVPLGLCEENIPENVHGLVIFPVEERKLDETSFVAVIKDAFFQRDLYRCLLQLEQAGMLDFLRKKYLSSKLVSGAFVPVKNTIYQSNSENTRVGFERILLVVYLALTGIGVGVVCLLVELLVYRMRVRDTLHK